MADKISRKKLTKPDVEPVKILRTEYVEIDSLVLYPRNPRRSELDPIIQSLKNHGQYKPVVVQDSTRQIVVGNHTTRALKRMGNTQVYAQFTEMSDDQAARIVMVDNKLGEKGLYDDETLAALLVSIDNPTLGTGYSQLEVDDITSVLEQNTKELTEFNDRYNPESIREPDEPTPRTFDDEPDDPYSDRDTSFDNAGDKLDGTLQLSDDMDLPASQLWGEWDLPCLDPDKLMSPDEWPADISVWAGGASRNTPANDDPDHWWLYVFGISSTSGMNHKNKAILCYYTYDMYFERWYGDPAKYTTRALNTGVKYAISPNFSTWANEPMFVSLESLYKARWIGRYLQEAGIKIIPDVEWPSSDDPKHHKFLVDYVLPSMPIKLPMIAMQGNTATGNVDKETMARDKKRLASQYRLVVDTLKPEALVFYGRPNWIEFIEGLGLQTNIISVSNHREEMNRQYRDKKKETL